MKLLNFLIGIVLLLLLVLCLKSNEFYFPKMIPQAVLDDLYKQGLIPSPTAKSVNHILKVDPGFAWKLDTWIKTNQHRTNFSPAEWNAIYNNWSDIGFANLVSTMQDREMAPAIKNLSV